MDEKKQMEELAGIEFEEIRGFETLSNGSSRFWSVNDDGSYNSQYRDYISHDACQRIIDNMETDKGNIYVEHLNIICMLDGIVSYKATPKHKIEAILKTYCKWIV